MFLLFALPTALPDDVARTPVEALASQAVVNVFHEGCETGELHLPASRGRMLRESEFPPIADVLPFLRKSLNHKVIKFIFPPKTYLVLADFQAVTKRSVVRTCTVVSKAITTSDASRALTWNIGKGEARAGCIPNMYRREWTYDRPDDGYRKRMRIRDDKSVLIEVANYANIPQTNVSEKK